ncbi:histidinol phosphate phosphatase HisJ family, partial [sediment metagenome]
DELPKYHNLIQEASGQFEGQLKIKCGIEADFIPGFEKQTAQILQGYPYDYVIGSVHFINGWGFDNPVFMSKWQDFDINDVYMRYHEHLRLSAQSKLFDIMGHADLVKKFGHRPNADLSSEVKKTAAVFKQTGMVIEINTSGLRKPALEIYPKLEDLKIYRAAQVPITFGSDAHLAQDVGRDFDKALELARSAGYEEYVIFEKRQITKRVVLK